LLNRISHRWLLLGQFWPGKANRRGGPAHEPQWSHEEIDRVSEECRLISFDRMSKELQNPTDDEESPSAQRQLKKKSGNEMTIRGIPMLCERRFSGCWCLAL
jgi:hypothetical protein